MKRLGWIGVALSLALVLAVALWEVEQRSAPGPLHPLHAAVEALQGPTGCPKCHGDDAQVAGARTSAAACAACHPAIAAQRERRAGLHGGLPPDRSAACDRCHVDHHGDASGLVSPASFAAAGIAERDAYRHEHVPGFPLRGRHEALRCAGCHVHADDAAPPPGSRFLGLSSECTACHEDRHRGAFGRDCAGCHGQEEPFAAAPGFVHASFALQGAHAAVACVRCHAEGTERAVAALRREPMAARACAGCHEDPHRGIDGAAPASVPLRDGADCRRCHDATAFVAARPDAAAHARWGFALRSVHATIACAECHGGYGAPARLSDPAPKDAACGACHASPHREPFVAAAVAAAGDGPQGCAGCHEEQRGGFAAGKVTAAAHAAAGFSLAAPHDGVECARCHDPALPFPARYPGRAPEDCRGCHRDPHGGQFDREPRYAQCMSCHDAAHFAPPAFDLGVHAATAFPLAGAHAAVACRACHAQVHDGVRAFAGTARECAACHRDVHGAAFGSRVPAAIDGDQGCARCHGVESFARRPDRAFDHAWAGYVLEGAHTALDCAKCHAHGEPDRDGRCFGRAAGTACSDCHADPHLRQFAVDGATDCARCHGEVSFHELRFDHQRSRFPLDGDHRSLPCSACHKEVATEHGAVTRYRPLGTRCGDCHRFGSGRRGGDR